MLHKFGFKFFSKVWALIFTSLLGVLVTPAFAADLQVDEGGKLTGAKNVNVGGSLYDVVFTDELLGPALYNQLIYAKPHIFNSFKASQASEALLDLVFVDSSLGAFDSRPELTRGCNFDITGCEIVTPYSSVFYGSSQDVFRLEYFGTSNGISDPVGDSVVNSGAYFNYFGNIDTPYDINYGGDPNRARTLALWSVAESISPVPEPETYSMLLMGFGIVGFVVRRRKNEQSL